MTPLQPGEVRFIPLDQIEVLNPRERESHAFEEIVGSIQAIGLKKPIVVAQRESQGTPRYVLVCGEGRMKAFQRLGETSIPALVISVSDEEAFIMSLTENIARRQCRPLELLWGIEKLLEQGYTATDIASKTGLANSYVRGLTTLIQEGEERLLDAVQRGVIPINAALTIASAGHNNQAMQAALREAYETGTLRGRPLAQARRIVELREKRGRLLAKDAAIRPSKVTTTGLVHTYQDEVARQRSVVRKATLAQQRLLFVVSALQQLLRDENFINLLRAEGLDTMPKYLAERLWPDGQRP